MARRQLLARPRLVELINERWRHRVVSVVAGPGCGKSVLLAQAISENALSPAGTDTLIECTAGDRDPDHLLARIADAVGTGGCRPGHGVTLDAVVAKLSERAGDVCLVFDDVDHLHDCGDSAQLLIDLVRIAPPSTHFVLAGRRRLRRLAAELCKGSVLEIDEAALRFCDAEIVALADHHDVTPERCMTTGGWPAVAALTAASGFDAAADYVNELIIDALDERERMVLIVAACLGAGDADLLCAAVGEGRRQPTLDALASMSRLPLIDVTDTSAFTVHALWRAAIRDHVHVAKVRAVIGRAIGVLTERHEFDRAFHLCIEHEDWDQASRVITACCTRAHAIVSHETLHTWLDALPADRHGEPEGLLLRAFIRRIVDPFGAGTADALERAMHAQRAIDHVAGEIAAGVQLLLVLRNQGRFEKWPALLARASELEAAGHPQAAVPAAVGRALLAECAGDDERMVAELSALHTASMSPDWQIVVELRLVMGHLVLGNEHEMLAAAVRCASLAKETYDRHALALAEWFGGMPQRAVESCEAIARDASHTQIASVLYGSLAAAVLATAGRVDDASRQLASIERGSRGALSALMRGALLWARATLEIANGDDVAARRLIEEALDGSSLAEPVMWRMAVRAMPLAYVLVPDLRQALDVRPSGSLHRRRLDVARAVVWAQTGGPTPCAVARSVCPGLVATTVPLPWAMALASALTARGHGRGRDLARYLFELYGEPARAAVRATVAHPNRRTADGARKLLAGTAFAPSRDVRLNLLGPVELVVGGCPTEDSHWGRERVRSLLVLLALKGGASREQIIDALWPHLDPIAADRNLRVTLTYLQQLLEPDRRAGEAAYFVRQDCSALTLAGLPHFELDVDLFDALLDEADDADRRGLPSVALALFERALVLWRGPCLPEFAYETWAHAACSRLTSRFVNAALRAAELNVAAGRPNVARAHALRALAADAWCEPAHQVLIRAAMAAGDRSGARRALADCDAMLADLDVEAAPETESLRRHLLAPSAPS